MKRTIACSAMLLGLVACASQSELFQQRMQVARAEANAASNECRQKRLDGLLPSRVASVDCSSGRIWSAFQKAGYPYMDLVELQNASRRSLAGREDRGEITEAQRVVEMANVVARVESEIARRDMQRQQAAQANAMAAIGMMRGFQTQPYIQPNPYAGAISQPAYQPPVVNYFAQPVAPQRIDPGVGTVSTPAYVPPVQPALPGYGGAGSTTQRCFGRGTSDEGTLYRCN